MEEKELRKMRRTELIEIIYVLQQNERNLIKENDELKKKLEEREMIMKDAGSIAEAAMKLNHIFEEAQSAADQYLQSVKASFPMKTEEPAKEEVVKEEVVKEEAIKEEVVKEEQQNE